MTKKENFKITIAKLIEDLIEVESYYKTRVFIIVDNDIILNAEIPFKRYHFKTMFPVININNVMCDTDLLTDKVRKLEKTKKQFDNENQHFRFIDFDPIIQEFTTAHKENNRKYIRVNSNSVKTALRIIKMCGDNRVKLCYDEVAFYKYPLLMLFEHGVFIIKNGGNEL